MTDIAAVGIAIFVAFIAGYHVGYDTAATPTAVQNTQTTPSDAWNSTTYTIRGYNITLQDPQHPDMNGSTIGYAIPDGPKHLYIQKGLSAETTYDTCVHEHLHQLGIGGSYNDHYWVNLFEDRLVNPLCLRLLARTNQTIEGPPKVNS